MNLNPKSRLASFLLTLFFGPLGLFYSSAVGALVLMIVAFVTFTSVIGPIVCWLLAIGIGDHCTVKHNQNIDNIKDLVSKKG